MAKKTCVIIGGGASGSLTVLELLKCEAAGLEIVVVDPDSELGRGRAYANSAESDLLNVPANKMSADLDRPNDFVEWIDRNFADRASFAYWPFVPRKFYGDYLSQKISAHLGTRITHRSTTVENFAVTLNGYSLKLGNGETLLADFVVIASGYERAPTQSLSAPGGETSQSHGVLIVGSGLSAIDLWRRHQKSFGGKITFLSRRGLLPIAHAEKSTPVTLPKLTGMSPIQILQVLRDFEGLGKAGWADIADAVRLQAELVWSCWTVKEKNRFLRHVKPYWEAIRHRVPLKVHRELAADIARGKLRLVAGRLQGEPSVSDTAVTASFRRRHDKVIHSEKFARVHFATGAKIAQNLCAIGEKRLGLRGCDNHLGYANESAPNLWVVGPASKTTFWEVTAVGEIRLQARSVAGEIARSLHRKGNFVTDHLLAHPRMAGENYFQHLRAALGFSWILTKCAGMSLTHAFFPFLFTDTTSNRLRDLAFVLFRRRARSASDFVRQANPRQPKASPQGEDRRAA